MEAILLGLRTLLTAVFGIAAIAKTRDYAEFVKTVVNFGFPRSMASTLAGAIVAVELGLCLSLLPVASARWAAAGCTVLLLSFTAVLTLAIARGRRPKCNCFGNLQSAPIGWGTVLRNVALVAAAVLVAASPRSGSSAVLWLAASAIVSLAFVLGAYGLVALVQYRRCGARPLAFRKRESTKGSPISKGLPIGTPAVPYRFSGSAQGPRGFDHLIGGKKSTVLVFVPALAGPTLLQDAERWRQHLKNSVSLALIGGQGAAVPPDRIPAGIVAWQEPDGELSSRFQARWKPAAVLVSSDGYVLSRLATGTNEIDELVGNVPDCSNPSCNCENPACSFVVPNSTASIGRPIPAFRLSDVSGQFVTNDHLKGRRVLIVSWNPGCPYCQSILEDLRRIGIQPAWPGPELLLLVKGSAEECVRAGIKATILLDPEFELAQQIGLTGTPNGVVVDDGRIVSDIVVSGPEVQALAGVDLDGKRPGELDVESQIALSSPLPT